MNVLLVPLFLGKIVIPLLLVAHITYGEKWRFGPVYTFRLQVNLTTVNETSHQGSSRLNVALKLICQPKKHDILNCYIRNTTVESFLTENLNPTEPGIPISDYEPKDLAFDSILQLNQDRFEVQFSRTGPTRIAVDRKTRLPKLNILRAIIGEMSIGASLKEGVEGSFQVVEYFAQGECESIYHVDRKIVGRDFYFKDGYMIVPVFGLKDGQMIEIRKVRMMDKCGRKVGYYFGNDQPLYKMNDLVTEITSSSSRMIISATEFTANTSNVYKRMRSPQDKGMTLYERMTLRLESVRPADSYPPEITNVGYTSLSIHDWYLDSSAEMEDFI